MAQCPFPQCTPSTSCAAGWSPQQLSSLQLRRSSAASASESSRPSETITSSHPSDGLHVVMDTTHLDVCPMLPINPIEGRTDETVTAQVTMALRLAVPFRLTHCSTCSPGRRNWWNHLTMSFVLLSALDTSDAHTQLPTTCVCVCVLASSSGSSRRRTEEIKEPPGIQRCGQCSALPSCCFFLKKALGTPIAVNAI